MKTDTSASTSVLLEGLGSRLAGRRLALDLTQADVAEQAGISKRTLERLESGAVSTRLDAFLRVCDVLGLQDRIDALVPEPAASPVARLKNKGVPQRQRASGQAADDTATPGTPWTWGA